MLLDKTINIMINNRNITFYKNKGYDCKKDFFVDIKPEDLSFGSDNKVNVKCDNCEYTNYIKFHTYTIVTKNLTEAYYCPKCSSNIRTKQTKLEKYGDENYVNSEKAKETCLKKYGTESYTGTPEYKEKYEKTCLEKYGCKSHLSNEDVKIKRIETCLEKYGVENVFQNEEIQKKQKETNLERYGVENVFQLESVKEKSKETCLEKYGTEYYNQTEEFREKYIQYCLERYGVENVFQNEEIKEKSKETCLEKYGTEYYTQTEEFKEKIKQTCLEKYGVEYCTQSEEIKEKIIQTCLKKFNNKTYLQSEEYIQTCIKNFGFDNPMKNSEIFHKQQISSFEIKEYSGIYYQGTYELDFLKNYLDKYEIAKIKSIQYKFDNSEKIYHPDFYLPKYNLIVEIKSDYTYQLNLDKNLAKQSACLEQGYNFLFIIDKKYDEFEKLL